MKRTFVSNLGYLTLAAALLAGCGTPIALTQGAPSALGASTAQTVPVRVRIDDAAPQKVPGFGVQTLFTDPASPMKSQVVRLSVRDTEDTELSSMIVSIENHEAVASLELQPGTYRFVAEGHDDTEAGDDPHAYGNSPLLNLEGGNAVAIDINLFQHLELRESYAGLTTRRGERDRFQFWAEEGKQYRIEVETQGSNRDAVLFTGGDLLDQGYDRQDSDNFTDRRGEARVVTAPSTGWFNLAVVPYSDQVDYTLRIVDLASTVGATVRAR